MTPYENANKEIVDNYCANLAISRKIGNTSRFGENSSWHEVNKRKEQVRHDKFDDKIH